MNNGYILLWRKLYETSFYKDSFALHLAIHLLLKANHETKHILFNQQQIIIERGQCICGRTTLSEETGMKPSTIRNKLDLLKNIGFLDSKTNNKFTVITIVKYSDYQKPKTRTAEGQPKGQPKGQQVGQLNNDDKQQKQDSKQDNKKDNQRTTKGQPEDTNNECNKLNALKERSRECRANKRFSKPEPKQVEEYAQSIGFTLNGQYFCDYYEARGWMIGKNHMKNWKAAVRTWKTNNFNTKGGQRGNSFGDHATDDEQISREKAINDATERVL